MEKNAVVIEDDILEGKPEKEWIKTVKNIISSKFSNGIPISGSLIKVNSISKNEFTKSKYSRFLRATDGTIYADKFRLANNLDEILLATTNYINEDLKHIRSDKIIEFARGDILLRVGNNDYSAKVIVGFTSGEQMLLYDIIDFKPNKFKIKKRIHQEFGESRTPRNDVSSNSTIPQNNSVVNRNYAQNTENNTNSVDEGKYSFGDEDEQYLQAVTNLAA